MIKKEQILSHLPKAFYPPIELPAFPGNRPNGILRLEAKNDTIQVQVWDGRWYKLEEKDWNFDLIADSILNRLKDGNNSVQS